MLFKKFRCRKAKEQLATIKTKTFDVLEREKALRRRLRELRTLHAHEEAEGSTLLTAKEYVDMQFGIPCDISSLEKEFEALKMEEGSLQRKIDRLS